MKFQLFEGGGAHHPPPPPTKGWSFKDDFQMIQGIYQWLIDFYFVHFIAALNLLPNLIPNPHPEALETNLEVFCILKIQNLAKCNVEWPGRSLVLPLGGCNTSGVN